MALTEAPVRNSTAHWKGLDIAHHLAPQNNYHALKHKEGGARIITESKGVWLTDSDGNRFIDGMAGLWCVQIGYGREELAEVAAQQMRDLPYYNSFFKTTTAPTVELAEALSNLTDGAMPYAFFGSGGSENKDSFVRMARFYWSVQGQPERKNFITRELAYHGSTQTAASLGGLQPLHTHFGLPLEGFHHVLPPYHFGFANEGESEEEFGKRAAQAVEDKILELGPETVAAFLGEPIMGAGGVLVPPSNYWPLVEKICRKYDILFAVDEVINGFGRTGRWFAHEHWNLKPDFMSLAKGISSGYVPLSAVLVADRVAKVLIDSGKDFMHGYTYSGHPVCCAVGLENIRILQRENIVENFADDMAPYFARRLQELFADHPLVGEVRVFGGLASIEMVPDKKGDPRKRFSPMGQVGVQCRTHCLNNGVISRAVRDSMILCPPLVMNREEMDEMLSRLSKSIDATAKELGII